METEQKQTLEEIRFLKEETVADWKPQLCIICSVCSTGSCISIHSSYITEWLHLNEKFMVLPFALSEDRDWAGRSSQQLGREVWLKKKRNYMEKAKILESSWALCA